MTARPMMRKPMLPGNVLLVGVDGGASEVRAHQVVVVEEGPVPELTIGPATASTCYERIAGFEPAPVAQQVSAHELGQVEPTEIEALQGEMWIEAAAGAILSVAAQAGARNVLVGMCMPGIKTADRRGVAVLKHGPRMPEFCAQLERELTSEGLRLLRPVESLASDGEASAWGEECDAQGLLRGVTNAYYLGGGTGLAEALKLGGAILGLDAVGHSIAKAWQLESSSGIGFEELLSMRGINDRYARRAGVTTPLSSEDVPEVRALEGDAEAEQVLREAADALVELCMARIRSLHTGGAAGGRGRHPKPGTALGRIVLGQHLGRLFAMEALAPLLRDRVEEGLHRSIEGTGSLVLCTHYLEGSALRPGLLSASTLRPAPAIGAAALALMSGRTSVTRANLEA